MLTQKLAERARALPVGDPREPETATGPMVNTAAVERVSALISDAVSKGARTVCGGEPDGRSDAALRDSVPARWSQCLRPISASLG